MFTIIDTLNPNENTYSYIGIKQPLVDQHPFFEKKTIIQQDKNNSETKDSRSQVKPMFLICVDGLPNCYTKTIENARVRMRKLAKDLIWKHITNYKSCIRKQYNDQNNIKVVGYSKEYIITYEQVLHHLTISEITSFY
jgi:hypothetical protein